ncbi:MAG: hypothetical protein DMG68_16965 [Acidobacteria bacterium]|jgi:hypothetical protein|nr:MAG: hypothetical protein DMG68_16965 [Acidobacteriota bacterium]
MAANSHKNGNTNSFAVLSLSRGAYKRVADKIGCDPSYVSRVARGERVSKPVLKALQAEMQQLRSLLTRAR